MRHYEIMACGAIPVFDDIACCPESTMIHLPKAELNAVYCRSWDMTTDYDLWQSFQFKLDQVLREKLTTKALARYVLDTVMTQ